MRLFADDVAPSDEVKAAYASASDLALTQLISQVESTTAQAFHDLDNSFPFASNLHLVQYAILAFRSRDPTADIELFGMGSILASLIPHYEPQIQVAFEDFFLQAHSGFIDTCNSMARRYPAMRFFLNRHTPEAAIEEAEINKPDQALLTTDARIHHLEEEVQRLCAMVPQPPPPSCPRFLCQSTL